MASRYIKRNGALLLHIPRTGGTWINRAIAFCFDAREIGRWHTYRRLPWLARSHRPIQLELRLLAKDVNFPCAFVRHPLAMYESWWRTLNNREELNVRHFLQAPEKWGAWMPAAANWRPDFGDWVRAMVLNEPMFFTRLYEMYIGPENGEICPFIGRTETLQADFFEVMRILGYEKEIDRHKEELRDWGRVWGLHSEAVGQAVWTDELRELVLQNERLAIKRFYGKETMNRRRYAELSEHCPPLMVKVLEKRMYSGEQPPFDIKKQNPNWGVEKQ